MKIIIGSQEFEFNLSGLKKIGRGGEGEIYLLHHQGKSYALKIYFHPNNEKRKKILAMLENSPEGAVQNINSLTFIQLAWPVGLCLDGSQFKGFVMPYVDTALSSTLDFYLDKRLYEEKFSSTPLSLAFKLDIAKNLAGVVKLLHSKGHFFIDFKPQNVRVYDRYHLISLIDCDGFSILGKGGDRFLAKSFSSEYIAPEALKNNLQPGSLAIEQDLFALAVVIFQILNYGIHPYSGLMSSSDSASTTDDKVAKGYYPYGRIKHPNINPVKSSVHETFDDEIRALFDRAFSGNQSSRPTVDEWISVIDQIQIDKKLVKCQSHPTRSDHIHFEGKNCQACYRDGLVKQIKVPSKIPSLKKGNPFIVSSSGIGGPFSSGTVSQAGAQVKSSLLPVEKVFLVIIGLVILIAFLVNMAGNGSSSSSSPKSSVSGSSVYNNPVDDIAGYWQLKGDCNQGKIHIFSSGANGGTIKWIYQKSEDSFDETISGVERLPNNRYKITTYIAHNPARTSETIFVKLGPNEIKPEKLINLTPEREMVIVNGKFLKSEQNVKSLTRCM